MQVESLSFLNKKQDLSTKIIAIRKFASIEKGKYLKEKLLFVSLTIL